MARKAQLLTAGLLAMVVVGRAATSGADPLILEVRVSNYAGLREDRVSGAKTNVASIFRAAGIAIQWVAPSGSDGSDHAIEIVIVPDRLAQRMSPLGEAMGVTPVGVVPARRAYLFASHIEEQASRFAVHPSTVLAVAMAHELGHVLLPGAPHSLRGIMHATLGTPEFRLANQGLLLFLAEQAQAMRMQIQRN